MMRMVITVIAIGCAFVAMPAQAQPNDWTALQTLISGQKLRVMAQGKITTGEFESATPTRLVISARRGVVYLNKADVKEVVAVTKRGGSHKWAILGVLFGGAAGYAAGQGAGPIAIPIDIAIFGGLGAWIDHKNTNEERRIVYSAP